MSLTFPINTQQNADQSELDAVLQLRIWIGFVLQSNYDRQRKCTSIPGIHFHPSPFTRPSFSTSRSRVLVLDYHSLTECTSSIFVKIFSCSFKIYGILYGRKQANIYTHVQCSPTSVGLAQASPNDCCACCIYV